MCIFHDFKLIFLCIVLGVTTSCVKYHQLVKSEFPQGEDAPDLRELAEKSIRAVTIYDQFSTLAIFDVLFLSDEVKAMHADHYGRRRGKDNEACKALLAQENKEQPDTMSFYILADLRVKTHKGLHEKGAYWTVALEKKDGTRVEATSIKNVDLDPEYQILFGYRFNLFKEVYLVTFPASSVSAAPAASTGKNSTESREPVILVVSSPRKSIQLVWDECTGKEITRRKLLRYDNCDWF